MKKLYFMVLLLFCVTNYVQGQEAPFDIRNTKTIEDLRIYPNPVYNGVTTITTQNNDLKKVSIFDVLGKQVLQQQINGSTLDVSKLNTGVYIVRIFENGSSATRKLIVK